MRNDNPGAAGSGEPAADQSHVDIKAQKWLIANPGADVRTSDGEAFGTVRETMDSYLVVRARGNLFSDVELYVPRDFVDEATDAGVRLNRSAAELKSLNLETPPAMQQG